MNWNRSQPTRMLYATADNAKNLFFPFPMTFQNPGIFFLQLDITYLVFFVCLFFSLYFSSSTFLQISFFILHVFFFSMFSFQVLWLSSCQSFCTTLRNINLILIFLLGKLKGCWDSKRKLEAILYLLLFYLVASCHVLHLVIGW